MDIVVKKLDCGYKTTVEHNYNTKYSDNIYGLWNDGVMYGILQINLHREHFGITSGGQYEYII